MKKAGENRSVTEEVMLSGKRTALGRHIEEGAKSATDEAISARKESFR